MERKIIINNRDHNTLMKLYNICGKLIMTQHLKHPGINEIFVEGISSGNYFVHLSNDKYNRVISVKV